ncbi:hypothetical protein HBI56_222890 [Parastagonospora nodorum]|uniref:BHLH domain-containing protein n=1 Tax=Phaeosphaeria nodorum (strain SN15 / ATCC MYA-4574 / FGSC 10173) TaxID=321614 RepID=A0A7U2EWA1_PHANO|nr:hypothetical protein HBH56_148080 [Parastagonospora nodorum]QRC94082.1 hypothetical protein JI435_073640 [Parastagonospora nodorum SN15]KAH3923244.1 hypothetical protein HBH54_212720 [Parastagonospora nodorum]KAH3945981.1 hypothetical protein HBH53_135540 [Parastagonospora nodorum]KAH3983578.1 hypothetical protein HBH52_064480 [Parastagonospora nodorum]
MGDKDASPFGYTFSGSLFDDDFNNYDASHSLLTEGETQSIADFFSNTDPFLADQHFPPATSTDTKHSLDEFTDWTNFMQPATVHGVSATIPDQAHLHNHNALFNDHTYAQPPPPVNHYGNTHNTQDDLQAASTLFQNSQASYANNNRSHSFHATPTTSQPLAANESSSTVDRDGKPLRVTPHGLINEQLSALLPNHNEEGTLDAQFAAQWVGTNAIQMYENEMERPNLKRAYTFGTDDSFSNPTGFSRPQGLETTGQVTRRLMRDLRHAEAVLSAGATNGTAESSGRPSEQFDEEQSEEASSEDEEDAKPSKKRRKSKAGKDGLQKSARNGKGRKASTVEEGKRKRAAAQKLQRENLTEEQKRSNHILSEQKRRNLIKRGFDDLHDLVPEIRNGGLSKSSVLTEAANFLENVIMDNNKFRKLLGG